MIHVTPNWGFNISIKSFWIGIHYSEYNKRCCINIIPCFTIFFYTQNQKIEVVEVESYWEILKKESKEVPNYNQIMENTRNLLKSNA